MIAITDEITLIDRTADDEEFWQKVFEHWAQDYFAGLDMPTEQKSGLIAIQYEAQSNDYATNYPNAAMQIVVYKGERVGRLLWTTEEGDLHLIDIGLLREFRNNGIGTAVLKYLLGIARERNLQVRFYVEKLNPAIRLYERMGFRVVEDLTGHLRLAWVPSENPQ